MTPTNVDAEVRHAAANRIKEILGEVASLNERVRTLHDELFIVHEQYICYPHDFVAVPSFHFSVDKCTKCGAEHVV